MITLITGGPGTGKTAWLIAQLLELRKSDPNRLLFVHGVRNLRGIAHEVIYCRSQLCDICRAQDADISARTHSAPKFVENWPDWKESGSLIVVDEVQRIWRPSGGGAAPSLAISALETHRHYGLDFWLISQGPHLFHNYIRLLVGRHVHLVDKWSGRKEYEWPECKQDVQSRSGAVERVYKLPSHVYGMYDSAEIHTKQEKRKPMAFYALIVAFVLAVFFISFTVFRIKNRVNSTELTRNEAVDNGVNKAGVDKTVPSSGSKPTVDDIAKSMTPVVQGLPWTAPIYKDLAVPVSMPVLSGCVFSKTKNRCSCYSQQATLIEVSHDVCQIYIDHLPFNHFRPDRDDRNYGGHENTGFHHVSSRPVKLSD